VQHKELLLLLLPTMAVLFLLLVVVRLVVVMQLHLPLASLLLCASLRTAGPVQVLQSCRDLSLQPLLQQI
jgi:hypothetical protein